MITDIIQKLVDRQDLNDAEARSAMEDLMSGVATDAQIAGFLTALRMKGETARELVEFARVMRERSEPFWDGPAPAVLDTCGTGGDRSGTFNISTAAAFVAAGAGCHVAKHGNRSATSLCGSADVMEALGVDIQMPIGTLRKAVQDVGIGFLFAQRFHRSMKHVMPARTQLRLKTIFNVIGPLSNPAHPKYQVLGVSSPEAMNLVAESLSGLGTEHAFVVHSDDGMDEISISAPTQVIELQQHKLKRFSVKPDTFGVPSAPRDKLLGGDASENAKIIEGILQGAKGPRRDIVLMNAAAAVLVSGMAASLTEGFMMASEAVDGGAAFSKLQALRELSR